MVLGAVFSWGTSATLARYMFRDLAVPPPIAVALRLSIAVVLMAPWLALRRPRSLVVPRADWLYVLILGLVGVASIQGFYYHTISVFGVGLAILLQYVAPSLVVLYAALRGARIRLATGLAVAAALGGTALLVGNVDTSRLRATPLDWLIGALSACSFAFYIVFSKRGLRKHPPETMLFYPFLIAALLWLTIAPPARIAAQHYSAATWGMFLALSIFSVVLPFTLFYGGLKRLSATETSILATFEPVVAIVSAAVVLGEGLEPRQWLGAALVLTAALLATRTEVREAGSTHA